MLVLKDTATLTKLCLESASLLEHLENRNWNLSSEEYMGKAGGLGAWEQQQLQKAAKGLQRFFTGGLQTAT